MCSCISVKLEMSSSMFAWQIYLWFCTSKWMCHSFLTPFHLACIKKGLIVRDIWVHAALEPSLKVLLWILVHAVRTPQPIAKCEPAWKERQEVSNSWEVAHHGKLISQNSHLVIFTSHFHLPTSSPSGTCAAPWVAFTEFSYSRLGFSLVCMRMLACSICPPEWIFLVIWHTF